MRLQHVFLYFGKLSFIFFFLKIQKLTIVNFETILKEDLAC